MVLAPEEVTLLMVLAPKEKVALLMVVASWK